MNGHTETPKVAGITLSPLDVMAFRDGRPFNAGRSAQSGVPVPQGFAGAMRTALMEKYGCDFEQFGRHIRTGMPYGEALENAGAPRWIAEVAFRGPWMARKGEKLDVYMPVPANLYRKKQDPSRTVVLFPLGESERAPGWQPPGDEPRLRPLWPATENRVERCKGWLTFEGLGNYLAGRTIPADCIVDEQDRHSLYAFDRRTGIGIDPDSLSTVSGQIYAIGFLSLRPGICFYGEAILPQDAPTGAIDEIETVGFGGEGRRSRLDIVTPVIWPEVTPDESGGKPFLLLTAPGFWGAGWKPSAVSGHLSGAAVPGSIPLSGWDLARGGPKPTRFGAPAGSTYFLSSTQPSLPDMLADNDEDRLVGYGSYLKGVWNNG